MVTGLIDFGWDVQAAIGPRAGPRGRAPILDRCRIRSICIESRMRETEELFNSREKGHRLIRQGEWDSGGAAQIIARDPSTGVLAGGSDPRAEGFAAGV
ncbi:MAG: hypothetical protein R2845_14160 [Thermomicrobiales bacterium]